MVKILHPEIEKDFNKELFRLVDGIIVLVTQGDIRISIDLKEHIIRKRQILTVSPHQILGQVKMSSDFKGFMVVYRAKLINNTNPFKCHLSYLLEIRKHPVQTLLEEQMDTLVRFCDFLHGIGHSCLVENIPEVQKGLLSSFFYMIGEVYNQNRQEDRMSDESKISRGNYIFNKFLELVAQYYVKERSVAFYADKLCITPKYLSTISREVSSKVATDIISNAVIMDAKSKLQGTSMTIQEISNSLCFPNPSFFGRYFKRHTGLSPMQFRGKK